MKASDLELRNPIARREYKLGETGKVVIVIGAPFAVGDKNNEFWCPYQITGMGREKVKRAVGVDALQALTLTLYKISTDLFYSDEFQEGRLLWEDGSRVIDLALPILEIMREDVKRFQAQIETLKKT